MSLQWGHASAGERLSHSPGLAVGGARHDLAELLCRLLEACVFLLLWLVLGSTKHHLIGLVVFLSFPVWRRILTVEHARSLTQGQWKLPEYTAEDHTHSLNFVLSIVMKYPDNIQNYS